MVDPIIQWFLGLFTQMEWRSVILLAFATFMFTHFVKLAWRLLPIKGGGRHSVLRLISGFIGLLMAFFMWPHEQMPWWIAGPVFGGGGAIAIFDTFFPLLRWLCPKCAAALNADRRKVWGLPPKDRQPWRKEDQ